jgi:hypothetical protein
MTAAGWLPTLSQIRTVPSEQLRDAARMWRAAAASWEEVFAQQRNETAQKVVLQGATADALEARAYNDWAKAAGKAYQLHEAAEIAELGANQFDGAREHALDAVAQARADGFQVAQDLSVTDTHRGGSHEERAARQVIAQGHTAYIRHSAARLVAVDHGISANLLTTTDGFGTISFDDASIPGIDDPSSNNGVQAVGYGVRPEAPSPGDPAPADQSTKTAEDVHKALDPLQDGKNKGVKTLPTPEEIRKAFEDLTKNAPEAPSTKKPYPGARRVLQDGTIIGIRENSGWGGPTVEVWYPDGERQDIHLPIVVAPTSPLPILDHPPAAPLPSQANHPSAVVPPTQIVDPATLPPWLQNPSPPGFQITPSESPPIFDWDLPDPPPPVPPMPPPSGPPITIPSPPPVSPEQAAVGTVIAGVGGFGAWVLSGLPHLLSP